MKNLDISLIPEKFTFLWWLSRIPFHYDNLIISEDQQYIFGSGNVFWDYYRGHLILVKTKNGQLTVRGWRIYE